tara:strand:- start:424 stop:1245 length:822 start_codon:yes stop_codon:yes gene_type:complete
MPRFPQTHLLASEIASTYGGTVSGDTAQIATPGHSASDRGTSIKVDHTAPGGLLVHCFNGTRDDALAVKEMLRRDGFCDDHDATLSDEAETARRFAIRKVKAEELRNQRIAARVAMDIMAAARPGDAAHPYLLRKRIPPENLWQENCDLLVPMFDPDEHLWNVQRISPAGKKLFLKRGRTKGVFWFAGTLRDLICIGEGMATMAAVRRATGYSVVAAMSASNLPAVAQIVRSRSDEATLFITADDDAAGIKAAREASVLTGARIVVPQELHHD